MTDLLSELARLAPKVAAEAALALSESPLESARQRGVLLCAEIASGSGAKLATQAMRALCARMLQAEPVAAESFARAAPGVVRANAAGLVEDLPAELCLRVESWVPGFVTKLGSSTLTRAPELCGVMGVQGFLTPARVSDVVAWAGSRYQEMQRERRVNRSKKSASEGSQRSQDFFKRANRADPRFESKFWCFYWDVKRRSGARDRAWCDQGLAKAASLPGSVDPFEGLPSLAHLGEVREQRLGTLVKIMTKTGADHEHLRALGRYLARAGEPTSKLRETWKNDIIRGSVVQEVSRNGEVTLRWHPKSEAANYLCLLLGSSDWLDKNDSESLEGFNEQGRRWLALAEGLAEGGAPSPVWSFVKRPGADSVPEPKAGPLLFLALGNDLIAQGPSWSWLVEGLDPREAQGLRTLAVFQKQTHRAAMERLLETIELVSAVGSQAINARTQSVRI